MAGLSSLNWAQMHASESISYFYQEQMSDYHSQLSRMNNAIASPVTSSMFYGLHEGIYGLPASTESELDSNSFDHRHGQLDGLPASYSQFYMECNSGPFSPVASERLDFPTNEASHLITMPTYENVFQQPVSLGKRVSAESANCLQNAKRRAIQIINPLPKRNSLTLGKQSALDDRTKNKNTASCFQEHSDHHIHQVQEQIKGDPRVPGRRTQKFADRITALQKIVSPYGKTDTASVLHEASVFIKVLLEQIQKFTFEQNVRKQQVDLRSKGLCLIPVSLMQKLIKEEESCYQHSAASMNSYRP